jgi:hypothetical protein
MSLLLKTRGKKDSNIPNLRIPGFKVEYLPKNPVSHFTDAGYRRHKNYTGLGNGRVSRVEGHRSRVICRGSKVEVEGQKSRSRVKSRGRGSKVEGRNSRVENGKY